MPLFKQTNKKLSPIKEAKIDLEKDIQKLTEENLKTVFELRLIRSEFSLQNFRIDTLAFDPESDSFVIIEYKKDRSFSVVDQGFAYLSLMLNNKDSFILEFAKQTKKDIESIEIDWSQSRVLFLANSFTSYQQNAINFKDLPIELWEVKKYGDNTLLYNRLKAPQASESIQTISKNETIRDVSREVKRYGVEDHIKKDWKKTKELFEKLRQSIFELDDRIEEIPRKHYIGYQIEGSNVVTVKPQKSKIVVELLRVKPEDIKDPEKKTRYRKHSMKYYNKHVSVTEIKTPEDITYAMLLTKQVYDKFFG